MADIAPDISERLASWRLVGDVVEQHPVSTGETGFNEVQVRQRQHRVASMCLNTVKVHDAFVADLKAQVEKGGRDSHHQQRVEDEAAFALGVFEQTTALCLESGIRRELENLPKEVIQTVYVQPPAPPKSWLQRVLGI